jgi:hypothetical protein
MVLMELTWHSGRSSWDSTDKTTERSLRKEENMEPEEATPAYAMSADFLEMNDGESNSEQLETM